MGKKKKTEFLKLLAIGVGLYLVFSKKTTPPVVKIPDTKGDILPVPDARSLLGRRSRTQLPLKA
ncbi:MAG: hypothetical protein R3A50_04835 [Saprospiraceae bacterium]